MLGPHPLLREFEQSDIRSRPADYHRSLKIFEALYREAVALGVLPSADPLEGIEVDIHLAEVLNVRVTPGQNR
jgi:hypothetical protein